MSPYFAGQPVTLTLFIVAVGTWVIAEFLQSLRRRSAARRDRGSYFLLTGCVAAGWVITAFSTAIPGASIPSEPGAFIVGLILAWCGIALRIWAFRTLGKYFTFRVQTSADQPVITTGPYKVLRHPGYTAILTILIGLSLLYGTWVGLIAMLILPTIGIVIRIRVEERALTHDLGPAYTAYAARHKRLIPFIW